jgi:hypothetical protein
METLSPELALVDEVLGVAARAALPSHPDVFAALERHRAAEPMRRLRADLIRDEAEPSTALVARRSPLRRPATAKLLVAACLAAAVAWTGFALAGGDGSAAQRAATPHAPVELRTSGAASPHAAIERRTQDAAKAPTRATQKHTQNSRHERTSAVGVAVAHLPPSSTPKPPIHHATKPAPAKVDRPVTHIAHRSPSQTRRPRTLSWAPGRKVTYYRVQVFRAADKPAFLFEVWTAQPKLQLPSTWVNAGKRQRLGPGAYRWVVYAVFGEDSVVGTGSVGAKPIADGAFSL